MFFISYVLGYIFHFIGKEPYLDYVLSRKRPPTNITRHSPFLNPISFIIPRRNINFNCFRKYSNSNLKNLIYVNIKSLVFTIYQWFELVQSASVLTETNWVGLSHSDMAHTQDEYDMQSTRLKLFVKLLETKNDLLTYTFEFWVKLNDIKGYFCFRPTETAISKKTVIVFYRNGVVFVSLAIFR